MKDIRKAATATGGGAATADPGDDGTADNRNGGRGPNASRGPLGPRAVQLYLFGLTASVLGTGAMVLVAGIWVKVLTGSTQQATLVTACVYAASLLAPLAGILADRVDRRRLLLFINLAAAAGLAPLLLVHVRTDVWLLFVVMTGYGVVLVLVDPAESALLTQLVPVAERGRVNGLRLSIQEGAKLVAPLLGALVFTRFGGGPVALLDSATFLVAAAAIALIQTPRALPRPPTRATWRADMRSGLDHLWHTHSLRLLVVVGFLAMAVSGLTVAARFALVEALHRPPSYLAVLTGLIGAGSIVAGLASGPILRRGSERTLAMWGVVSGILGYLMLSSVRIPLVLLGSALLGLFLPWVVIAVITSAQRLTPDHLQGKVAAALNFVLFAPQPFAQALGVPVLKLFGYRGAYLLAALVGGILVVAIRRQAHRTAVAGPEGTVGIPLDGPRQCPCR